MQLRYPINLHKSLTFAFVLSLMAFYQNFTIASWVYLALHGSYGIMWLIKDSLYPDRQWKNQVSIAMGVFTFIILGSYWVAPYLLISRKIQPSSLIISVAVITYLFGIFLHYGSDAQKYFTLKYKKGLITEGFFSRSRNPNYLGEILIYLGFAILSQHWLPFLILGLFSAFIFVPNMRKKDQSLARYPEFTAYKEHSSLLLPKIFINQSTEPKINVVKEN